MKARMLSIVWGERHLDWFSRACVASLARPDNITAIHREVEVWDIVTRAEDAEAARNIARHLGVKTVLHVEPRLINHGEILQLEIMQAMRRCLAGNQSLLMAPPDTIFADGTISSIFAIGRPEYVCVLVPHARVLPSILLEPDAAMSCGSLVEAAWRNLHRTWVEADATLEFTNTYAGGVSWRTVGEGLYAVQHRLPTVYLAKFSPSDLEWWEAWQAKDNRVGAWDHFWPSKLVAEERQRVVGSSDGGFLVEVTDEFTNIPPVRENDPRRPDECWGSGAHFLTNRSIVSVFRASPRPRSEERSP